MPIFVQRASEYSDEVQWIALSMFLVYSTCVGDHGSVKSQMRMKQLRPHHASYLVLVHSNAGMSICVSPIQLLLTKTSLNRIPTISG